MLRWVMLPLQRDRVLGSAPTHPLEWNYIHSSLLVFCAIQFVSENRFLNHFALRHRSSAKRATWVPYSDGTQDLAARGGSRARPPRAGGGPKWSLHAQISLSCMQRQATSVTSSRRGTR